MRRAHLLIFSAWLIHAVAWFLPVITDGVRFPHGLPGWEAFRTALSPLWAYGTAFSGIGAVASVLSAVTTILFVAGSPWVLWRGSRSAWRASAWIAIGAFVLDAHWYFFYGRSQSGLLIGYFVWWVSFLLMAIALFDLVGRRDGDSKQTAAASPSSSEE